ncbi:endo-1,4-beta-xylanase [Paenibacillus gansuensis]|uniref:Beta-xylanase n=1 Tax=Paenibacillus gansuensis TaxID=306542 RepID=A0ABW5P7T4_9BACL
MSKKVLLERLETHIKTLVGRYKGKIYAWDVVNEAVSENGSGLRETPWLDILGEEYIAKAFQWAHEADPDALLFYNGYDTENKQKRQSIHDLILSLQQKGVPIHGIGLQGHSGFLARQPLYSMTCPG